jgi:hypothetical protein
LQAGVISEDDFQSLLMSAADPNDGDNDETPQDLKGGLIITVE